MTHHARLLTFIKLALDIGKHVFVFGAPGHSWTPYEATVQHKPLHRFSLRCCSLGLRYDKALNKPSASYMKLYSTHKFNVAWACACKCAESDHVRDWSGSDREHARFRTNARTLLFVPRFMNMLSYLIQIAFLFPLPPLRLVRILQKISNTHLNTPYQRMHTSHRKRD